MKLSWKQIEPFIQKPDPAARVILVYGPDDGLMRERARTMGKTVTPDLNDPFNVAVLSTSILTEYPARLSDEAGAVSMMGGDRLIRIEDAADKLTVLIKSYLENPSQNTLVILEAGDLGPRSSLRKLCESSPNAAAVPCYVDDERSLSGVIRTIAQDAGKRIEADAVSWLTANISGDRQKVRSELEKLIIFKGLDESPITLTDALSACGAAGAHSLDDLVYTVGGNQPGKALATYNHLLEEGVNFIVIVRALQNHFRRLHLTKSHMQNGASMQEAMNKLMPRVFFKQEDAFKAQANRWSLPALNKVLSRLMDLEAQCKTTGAPVETLCSQAVLGISAARR